MNTEEVARTICTALYGAGFGEEEVRAVVRVLEARPDPIKALCEKIDADIRRCDHGYIHVSCGQCMSAWLPR